MNTNIDTKNAKYAEKIGNYAVSNGQFGDRVFLLIMTSEVGVHVERLADYYGVSRKVLRMEVIRVFTRIAGKRELPAKIQMYDPNKVS